MLNTYVMRVITLKKEGWPMKIKTSTQNKKIAPSPQTISLIKQIAYAYRIIKQQGKNGSYLIN